jgi:tetratricopeptide (TPR) repeat protein
VEAREAYRKVKFFHPTSATEAEGAAERVGGRLVSSLREEAQLRAARREWEEARRCLERLLALAPDDRDAKLAHSECTREVQRAHRRAAEAFEARGLAGNALVSYLDAVEAAPEDSELRAAAGRVAGALRSEIVFAPRLEVDSVESETGLEGQFWALSGGGAAAALRGLRRGFDEALDAPPLESGAARGARPGRVFVEALDLTVEPTTATCGVVTDRFAGALVLSENPRRQRAAVELTATEQVREGARSRWEAAPDYAKGFVGDELELASLRVEQAELLLAAEPASVPVCQWEGGSYEVHDVVVSTRLWAYVRIDGEAAGQWVSVSRQESDRVVASSGNAQVAADPLEVASRERLLDSLAVGLGRRVREEARRSFDEGLARHYRRGLERLRAGSRESAVEHFVRFLVSEAPAPSTTPPAEREDALHRLEGLTQSGSLRRWLDLSSGR